MVKTIPSFVLGRLNASTYQPRTPRRSNSLRPCWMIVLTILLLHDATASAQIDRLRKSKALNTTAVVETPMVEIPAGEFTMGLDGMQALEDERPKHQVWLPAFFMDLHEVTTMQYAAFLAAT